jgi:prepilin-type N-terminal cleavage/methylation domain-containing protein/prepilin-type processing-associated H-X9-DG protein
MKRVGFTLIELLVVIAIIAILAAILFPVFAQAREKARQTGCVSNEKNIGLAILQYAQDYDEYFPLGQEANAANQMWAMEIMPYIKNGSNSPAWGSYEPVGGVFTCPSAPDQGHISYCARSDVFPDMWNGATFTATSEAAIDAPASKVMIFEFGSQGQPGGEMAMFRTSWYYWTSAANGSGSDVSLKYGDCDIAPGGGYVWWGGCPQYPRYRHNKTTNVLWLDGHVKSIVRTRLDWQRDISIPAIQNNTL